MIYVYPNGEVRDSIDYSMSDDYFMLPDDVSSDEVVDVVLKHFGKTEQAIDVIKTIVFRDEIVDETVDPRIAAFNAILSGDF